MFFLKMFVNHFSFFHEVLRHILWVFSYCIVCLFLCFVGVLFYLGRLTFVIYITSIFSWWHVPYILTVFRVSFVNSSVVQSGVFFLYEFWVSYLALEHPNIIRGENLLYFTLQSIVSFFTCCIFFSFQFNPSGLNF